MKGVKVGFHRYFHDSPDQDAQPCKGNDDALKGEKMLDFSWRDKHQRELNEPVKKIAHHACENRGEHGG